MDIVMAVFYHLRNGGSPRVMLSNMVAAQTTIW